MNDLSSRVTILVNSCDNYSDLWYPFFKLLKKYWVPMDVQILFNTESVDYSFEGLDIRCIHPNNPNDSYGKRMLDALSKVNTPYVIPLLDDFFLREKVDLDMIKNILNWMDLDKKIVYFNCDDTPVYAEWENDRYPGFHRIPYGNVYTLNMQAAVWRTDKLKKYWKPNVSPWEWEEYTNLIAARNKTEKFYCVSNYGNGFCNYGYKLSGMGVHHGKWVKDDIIPLFEKENINVDFSKRGFLENPAQSDAKNVFRDSFKKIKRNSDLINRCLSKKDKILYLLFIKRNKVIRQFKFAPEHLYIKYILLKNRQKFFNRKKWRIRISSIYKKFF